MRKRLRALPVPGLVVLSVLLSACAHEAPLPRTESPAEAISAGVTHRTVVRSQPTPLAMHVVEINLAKAPGALKVVANQSAPDGGMIATTVSRLAAKAGFFVAVNASFFQVPGGRYPEAGESTEAVGGLILEGRTIELKGPGLGLINGGLCIEGRNVRIEKGFECRGATYGLASGPLLLWHGQPVETEFADRIFKAPRHPRTAIGVDSARKKVWLIVADGRQEGVSEGATLDELKQTLKELGAFDALNLDGGGSSTLVARVNGAPLRVLNVPIHGKILGRERPVVTALGMTSGEPDK
jgi:exopolysaccharide biosynthesis protein